MHVCSVAFFRLIDFCFICILDLILTLLWLIIFSYKGMLSPILFTLLKTDTNEIEYFKANCEQLPIRAVGRSENLEGWRQAVIENHWNRFCFYSLTKSGKGDNCSPVPTACLFKFYVQNSCVGVDKTYLIQFQNSLSARGVGGFLKGKLDSIVKW